MALGRGRAGGGSGSSPDGGDLGASARLPAAARLGLAL
jgi:hypothetical protein